MSVQIIQGSFHQGNPKFVESAGKQCTCCSLVSIAFTKCKSPARWNRNDLDFIVDNGDLVYKSLNTERYLMVTDLPQTLTFFESNIKIEMLESKYGVLTVCSQTGLIFNRNKRDSTADGALLMFEEVFSKLYDFIMCLCFHSSSQFKAQSPQHRNAEVN